MCKLKVGLLFSGQGAQTTGMGQSLYDHNSQYRAAIDHASDVLGYNLSALYFDEGFADKLNQTQYAQPAIVAMSCAIYQLIADELPTVTAGIGLSLGEYSALAAAGHVEVDDALRLVKKRGQLMQQASDETASKMVAVLNTPVALIQEACTAATAKTAQIVTVANVNTPKQIVIGGEVNAVDAAVDYLSSHEVKRMVPLNVSGAFHTPLMQSAQAPLNTELAKINWHDGEFPIISNTTKQPFSTSSLTETLTKQLISPTFFADTVAQLDGKVDAVIELGPGKTLMSLAKKIIHGINYFYIDSTETLSKVMAALKEDTDGSDK